MPLNDESVAVLTPPDEAVSPVAPKKVGFVSLGCPKNLVDSEVMMGLLAHGGAEITPRAEDADIIVVNTCSFIDKAQQESVDAILEMAQHKIAGRAQKLIVAGCLVERYRNEIQKNIPEVDAVVGTGELQQILCRRRNRACAQRRRAVRHPEFALRRRCPRSRRALLQRRLGRRHRRPAELPVRREHAAPAGHAEIFGLHQDRRRMRSSLLVLHHSATARQVSLAPLRIGRRRSAAIWRNRAFARSRLIGQDTTCYGEDLGLKDGLALLLERLAQIEELRWVRFLYAYPNKITGKLLETIAAQREDLLLH